MANNHWPPPVQSSAHKKLHEMAYENWKVKKSKCTPSLAFEGSHTARSLLRCSEVPLNHCH